MKTDFERLRDAISGLLTVLYHNGVPTDSLHPTRFACDLAEAVLADLITSNSTELEIAQPAKPAFPRTDDELIAFIGSNFEERHIVPGGDGAEPEIRFVLTAHDLLSAFSDYQDFAPTQQRVESQWISCDERLPDCCTEVIVWPHPSDVCMTGECDKNGHWTYAEYESNWGWHAINILSRTHWMPLPKPPTIVQPVKPAEQEPTAEQAELSDDKSINFPRDKWNAFARFIQADIKSGDCSTNFINAWMELEAEGKS